MESQSTYRIVFQRDLPVEAVEDTLMMAVMAVECLVGRPALKLEASFRLDKKLHTCTVDASTPAGQHIARVFVGLMAREFGEGSFTVERDGAAKIAGGQQG